jgi:NADPH-dependent 2,4-dienoyl-CoA reductase/sulfur reductase-like enzyme
VEAAELGDRLALMIEGRIVQEAAPRERFARPASTVAARFLGANTILRGTVTAGRLAVADAALPVTAPDGPATAIIRPEHLHCPRTGRCGAGAWRRASRARTCGWSSTAPDQRSKRTSTPTRPWRSPTRSRSTLPRGTCGCCLSPPTLRGARLVNADVVSRYDLVVIGGGTAGMTAAVSAAGLGARVLLAEADRTGGDCLWTG